MKKIFKIGSLLLWLIVVSLAAELLTRLYVLKLAAPSVLPATLPQRRAAVPVSIPALKSSGIQPCLHPFPDAGDFDGELEKQLQNPASWQSRWHQLSDSERNHLTQLHGQVVFQYKGDGVVEGVWGGTAAELVLKNQRPDREPTGSYFLQIFEQVIEDLQQHVPAASDGSFCFTSVMAKSGARIPVCMMPDTREKNWLVFVGLIEVFTSLADSDAESIFEIPYFALKKNLTTDKFKTNSLGFREIEILQPKPPDIFRIIFTGGSTVFEGSDDQNTVPALVQELLLQAGLEVESINCGCPGMFAWGHALRFCDYVSLHPDLIVVYEGINDLIFGTVPWLDAAHLNTVQRLLAHSWLVNTFAPSVLYPAEEKVEQDVEFLFTHYMSMNQMAREAGVPLVFCSIVAPDPDLMSARDWFELQQSAADRFKVGPAGLTLYLKSVEVYNRRLKQFCDETGADFLPLAEQLVVGKPYFYDLCHMPPEGLELRAKIIAESLGQSIQEKGQPPPI